MFGPRDNDLVAQQYDAISDRHRAFIERQPMFFVATAAREGHVNVSPKGLDSFRVLGTQRVAWLNGTGSGNETAAHLLDTTRMTVMFCSFAREPLILRLFGTARTVQPDDDDWDAFVSWSTLPLFADPGGPDNPRMSYVDLEPLASPIRERPSPAARAALAEALRIEDELKRKAKERAKAKKARKARKQEQRYRLRLIEKERRAT